MSISYPIGSILICDNVTVPNHEGLVLGEEYILTGKSVMENADTIYSVISDYDKSLHHSINRFHLKSDTGIDYTINSGRTMIDVLQEDSVNHPSHYTQYRVEVLDIIEDATKDLSGIKAVALGNVIKYVLRYQFKNGVEDLEKARFYLDKLIEYYK